MIDTHAHLSDRRYPSVPDIIKKCGGKGVSRIINVGYDLQSSLAGSNFSKQFENVFFAAGVHPSEANEKHDFSKIEILLTDEKCVAVGEAGLDYHYDGYDKKNQRELFEKHILLGEKYALPIIIHSRDAIQDMCEILKSNRSSLQNSGVMHHFSGSNEVMKNYLDMGFYISFSGVVSFKNNKHAYGNISYCPDDRILAETDSPYLTPEPYRGQINYPYHVAEVYKFIAAVKQKDMTAQILKNAKLLFRKLK